jgi:REP element-mobilizing transposase RayT
MARPLRIQFPGAVYHVLARGNARQNIFLTENDRRHFLAELWRACDLRNWLVWAYCLMGNHYHLVLETVEPTLSIGMRDLDGRYALAFNQRHGRVGHLFQGRFEALLVQRERYLLTLMRYVMLNPVRAGFCVTPDEWRWSSYLDMAGVRRGASPRLAVGAALALFAPSPIEAREQFTRYVLAGIGVPPPSPHEEHPRILGDDDFVARVTQAVQPPDTEVPRRQRQMPLLSEIFAAAATRDEGIRRAYQTGAYKLADIGRFLGLHYATVSRIVNRRQPQDPRTVSGTETRVDNVAEQDLTPS